MDPLVIVLRLVHVVCGAVWVGMVTFATFFLQPAVQEVGPDGGKVMGAIQRRGLMTVVPLLAIATLVSGLWLYLRAAGGQHAAYARSPMGMAFGLGGLAAMSASVTQSSCTSRIGRSPTASTSRTADTTASARLPARRVNRTRPVPSRTRRVNTGRSGSASNASA